MQKYTKLHPRKARKNSQPQRINTKAYTLKYPWYITLYICVCVNQHKPADFRNYAWKVVGDICNSCLRVSVDAGSSQSVHPLCLYRCVWLWNRGLSTLGSVAEKEGETLTRRVAREGGSLQRRGGGV